MDNLLKALLKKDTTAIPEETENETVIVEKGTVTSTNQCETIWNGSFTIPEGQTRMVVGTITQGLEGSGNSGNNPNAIFYLGTFYLSGGNYPYFVNLGNSGQDNVMSSYKLEVYTDEAATTRDLQLFQRNSQQNSNYDGPPC